MRLCHYGFQKIHSLLTYAYIRPFFVIFIFPYSLLIICNQIWNIFNISGLWKSVTSKLYVNPRSHSGQLNSIILKISVIWFEKNVRSWNFITLLLLITPESKLEQGALKVFLSVYCWKNAQSLCYVHPNYIKQQLLSNGLAGPHIQIAKGNVSLPVHLRKCCNETKLNF